MESVSKSCSNTCSYWSRYGEILNWNISQIGKQDLVMIIDMQTDFICPNKGTLAVNKAEQIVDPIVKLVKHSLLKEVQLFFTRDYHDRYHCSFLKNGGPFPDHCLAGTPGAKIVEPLSNIVKEFVITSQRLEGISVLFKGFHSKMDSYGSFCYDADYAAARDLDHNHSIDACNEKLTGAFDLPVKDRVSYNGEGKVVDFDLNANPVTLNLQLGTRAKDLVKEGVKSLYIAGLAFDYCVLDTAITARQTGLFSEIYIIVNMTQPIDKSDASIENISAKLRKEKISLINIVIDDRKEQD